jgi:hypothetical protein
MIVSTVILVVILVLVYVAIGYNIYGNFKISSGDYHYLSVFFWIMYLTIFIVLSNIVMMSIFYNKMIKIRGAPGALGISGQQGPRGNRGQCQIFCLSNNCTEFIRNGMETKIKTIIEAKHNDAKLGEIDIKYLKSGKMKITKDIIDPNTGKSIKTKFKNNLLEKMVNAICKSNEYNTAISAFQPKKDDIITGIIINEEVTKAASKANIQQDKLKESIEKILKNTYKLDLAEKGNYKLQQKFADTVMEAAEAFKTGEGNATDKKFTPTNVQEYIKDIFGQWMKLICDSLSNPYTDFFNKEYATNSNTEWIDDKNPFDEIIKYDLYHWGLTRLFFPAHIKIDEKIQNYEYLPEGPKPPLKYIQTNDLEWVYDSKLNRVGSSSEQPPLIMKDENGEDKEMDPSDIPWKDLSPENIAELKSFGVTQPTGNTTATTATTITTNSNGFKNTKFKNKERKNKEGFQSTPTEQLTAPHTIITKPPYQSSNKLISIWRNKNKVHYENEDYYPVGTLVIQNNLIEPDGLYSTSVIENGTTVDTKKYRDTIGKSGINKNIVTDNDTSFDGYGESLPGFSFRGPKTETILVTGDVQEPKGYELLVDNNNTFERNNVSIYRPICADPLEYDSVGDIAVQGFGDNSKPEAFNYRCLPKKCLEKINTNDENSECLTFKGKKSLKTMVTNPITEDVRIGDIGKNGYNFFRYDANECKEGEDSKPLYRIKDGCLNNSSGKKPNTRFGRIGLGWHGRPYRDPKYSIFSYLSQFPEAIITSRPTGYKYYIIHTELFNNNTDPLALYKTSAKNLYYILAYNFQTNNYDRCYSARGKDEEKLMTTRIKSEDECYWIIEYARNNNTGQIKDPPEIRLISKKTGKYFLHKRREDLRRTVGFEDLPEKQVVLDDYLEVLGNNDKSGAIEVNPEEGLLRDDYDGTLFVNIKSAFGTDISTALDVDVDKSSTEVKIDKLNKYPDGSSIPRLNNKFYNEPKNKHPTHRIYPHPDRGNK